MAILETQASISGHLEAEQALVPVMYAGDGFGIKSFHFLAPVLGMS